MIRRFIAALFLCFLLALFSFNYVGEIWAWLWKKEQSTTSSLQKKQMCVIINPIAGGKKQDDLAKEILYHLDRAQFDVQILYTERPDHATQLTQEAIEQSADIIVAVGGDGSINEISQALIGSGVTLGIIPTGSGNGLARHLRVPLNVAEAISVINQGRTTPIDSVQMNDKFYLGAAGIGFDAEVSEAFAKFGHRGFLSYLIVTMKELPQYRPRTFELSIDGKKISREAFLICFANSSQFGNDAVIAPTAQINDGYLDVVIVKKFPLYASARIAYQLFNRSFHRSDYVEVLKCKEVDITQTNVKAHIDGEPAYFRDGIHLKIVPSSINVLVP